MMYNYPFFSFPYFRRYPVNPNMYYNRSSLAVAPSKQNPYDFSQGTKGSNNEKKHKPSTENKTTNSKASYGFNFLDSFFHQTDRGEDESYFDLFGLKLYNDDLLLIGMIFFLYKEDVKDQYLFIALILLLLS